MVTSTLIALAIAQTSAPFEPGPAWDKIERAIRTTYYARSTQKDRMERLLDTAEPGARRATTLPEFQERVRAMISEFGDSHFDLYTRSDQGFYTFDSLVRRERAEKMPHIGAWFRRTSEGYAIRMVLDGGPAAQAGLRKGDVVTTIDERPFSPIDGLRPSVGKRVSVRYLRAGVARRADVAVVFEPALDAFLAASRASGKVIERDGVRIGHWRLWVMVDDRQRAALQGFVQGRAQETDAFVLDLRDGFGGRPEGYADPFFRPEVTLEWGPPGQGLRQAFGYQKPLVVLINEGSRSAKEVLAYILKLSGRATLVGSTTAGDVLGTTPSPLGEWGYLEVPMVELRVDGQRLEGKGVAPDVSVGSEFGPEGDDRALERALEVAVEKAKGSG